jgi:glycosyltransferase involved in cell wall biosynthesis
MVHKRKLRFVTFFPGCQNIHLIKDVGMIPYVMHKDFGYDSYMMCYPNEDYLYLETEVPGLKMILLGHNLPLLDKAAKFLEGRSSLSGSIVLLSTLIDSSIALLRSGRDIDILQLYHLKPESFLVGLIYRIINPTGILYLKLDLNLNKELISRNMDHPEHQRRGLSLRYFLFDLAHFDIISAESRGVYAYMREFFPFFKNCRDRIYYLPDGIDAQRMSTLSRPFEAKKNAIIHIGRIGNPQKASDLALEAFADICEDFPNWELLLIGSMDRHFYRFIEELKSKRPSAASRISYLGFVERDELYRRYSEAKILLMPSRWESFGLVVAEAGALGNVLLGSDIPPFQDMTEGGKLGYLCPVDSLECLTERLRHMLSHNEELGAKSDQISRFIRENFDWKAICGNLNNLILGSSNNRSGKS